eukprot:m.293013 g.293013  ORF g.293013 m.293013 type:complete len:99 (+) comp17997_c0_seq1:254-550(+)
MASDIATQEANLRASINQRLIESGKKEELKNMLRSELMQSQWREQVKNLATEKIRANHGQMTVEELVALITPEARSKVPVDAKTKLLEGIREALRDDK